MKDMALQGHWCQQISKKDCCDTRRVISEQMNTLNNWNNTFCLIPNIYEFQSAKYPVPVFKKLSWQKTWSLVSVNRE